MLLEGGTALAQEGGSDATGEGILSGNAVSLDLDVPITICGVLGSLLGGAGASSCIDLVLADTASSPAAAEGNGILSGNAFALNIDVPIVVGSRSGDGFRQPTSPTPGASPVAEEAVAPATAGPDAQAGPPPASAGVSPDAVARHRLHRLDAARRAQLPRTGVPVAPLVAAAVGLLGSGAAMSLASRRRRSVV